MARIFRTYICGFAEAAEYTIDAEIKGNRLVLLFRQVGYQYGKYSGELEEIESFDIDGAVITRGYVLDAICKVYEKHAYLDYCGPQKEEDIDISGLIPKR